MLAGLTRRVSTAHRTDPGLARPILGHLSHPDPSTKTPILLPILTGNCRWNQYWVIFHHTQPSFQSLFCCKHPSTPTCHQHSLSHPDLKVQSPNFVCKAVDVGETCTCAMYKCTNDESNDKDSTCLTKNRIPPKDHPDPCWKQQFLEQILVGMNESLLLPLKMRMRMRSHLK